MDPKNLDAWKRKGYALSRAKRYEDAIASYDRLIEMKHEDADVWARKGIAFDMLGRAEEATTCFNKAIELDPTDSYEWTVKGYKTEKDADGHHDMFVTYARASYARGDTVRMPQAGYYNDAIKYYDKAIESDTNNKIAQEGKNSVLNKQKQGW